MLNQISFHKSLLSAPAVSFAARAKHVDEDIMKFEKRTGHVKWKIYNKYHETAPLWAILGVKYISGWDFSKWRTHRRRINGTSNVFFFVIHHYEAVNLSARGIFVHWSPGWSCNYYRSTSSHFTVGGGTYGEKIDQIKVRQQVFYCSFWPHLHESLAFLHFLAIFD